MKDLLIGDYDTYTNDLLIDPTTLDLKWATDVSYIVQKLKIRLQWFNEEWYLDTRLGIDWFGDVLIANPRIVFIDGKIKDVIKGTPGVLSLLSYTSTFDRAARTFSVTFEVKADTGAVIGPLTVSIP